MENLKKNLSLNYEFMGSIEVDGIKKQVSAKENMGEI